MRSFFLLKLAIGALLTSVVAACGADKLVDAKPKTQWMSVMGGLPEAAELVIKDAQDWKSLWVRLSQEELPAVDFSKQMLVAVFMGVKHTGGFSVAITDVVRRRDKLEVRYRSTSVPKGGYVIQAFTSPYHIKLVLRTESPVVFKRVK
ncbi:MAG: protease complex subunit PrcB family protein [Elusimicrobiota bacterium]